MKNRVKLVVLCGLMAFPMMVAFQNCSKTVAMQMTDEINGKTIDSNLPNGGVDTDQLPNGVTDIDQTSPDGVDGDNSPSGGEGDNSAGTPNDPEMNYQVEDPVQELQNDLENAPADCAADLNESSNDANGELSEDGRSLNHIRGNKVISPADFNGATEVDVISDAFGKITVCGLRVRSWNGSGGRLILVNSVVDDLHQHNGGIVVLESSAIITGTKGKLLKYVTEEPQSNVVSQNLRRVPVKVKK